MLSLRVTLLSIIKMVANYEMVKTLGDVLFTDACLSTSTITIPNAVCKNGTTLWKVTLRDSSGNLVDGSVQVSAILTEISTGERSRFHFDQKEHGSFEAICIIRNLGNYDVTVLVNGEHFKDGCVIECIENESDFSENGSDQIEEENGLFCNGEVYYDSDNEFGSSDLYLEDEDDEFGKFNDKHECLATINCFHMNFLYATP